MTKRSMPCLFHANLYVLDGARCPSSACGAFHCWCRGRFAYSGARSLALALPVTFSLLVLSALFPVPNDLPRVPGGCGGRVWVVPVDGLGIGEGGLRYNRLEH